MYGDIQGYIHRRALALLPGLGKTAEEAEALATANAPQLYQDAMVAIHAAMAADHRADFNIAWQGGVRAQIDGWITALAD